MAAAALIGLTLWRGAAAPGPVAEAPASASAARVGGPFQLVDQNGRMRDQSLLQGRWSLVFFGFTSCPDICPTTLQTLGAAKEALGPAGERLQLVLVSVDPARDTPAQLKSYLESGAFTPGVVGLTGTPQQIAVATLAYGAYAARVGEGEGYTMQHTSLIYLMDPEGRFSRIVRLDGGPAAVAAQLREAMAAGGDGNAGSA